jgi:hypothetical protein
VRIDNQSNKLSKLVKAKSVVPRYEVILPIFDIKKKSLKHLKEGSIIDTSYESLEFWMLQDGVLKAKVEPTKYARGYKLKIVDNAQHILEDSLFVCCVGYLHSRCIDIGHKLDISSLDLEDIDIRYKAKTIAKGKMVMVDKKASIMITKVYDR